MPLPGTDVLQQPGLLSAFAVGLETTPGTYVGPTTLIDAESFQITDDPAIIEFEVMRRSRNTTQNTRAGIHKVVSNATAPFYTLQGMPLWKALVGTDTMSGAADVALTISTNVAVGDLQVAVSSVPAPPAGVGDWGGIWLKAGSGATLEHVQVLGVVGTTISTTPFQFAHATTDALVIPPQHIIQETTGNSKHILPTLSATMQFAEMFEWDVPFGFVQKGGLKGDTKTIKSDWSFAYSALPVTPGSLTAITQSQSEHDDMPWIMRDGGVITPFRTSDVTGQMHKRILSLDYELDNGLIAREYGGGVQLAEQYIPGARKHSIKFKEDAGQYSTNPELHTNYVNTQTSMAAFLSFVNPVNSACFGAFFPNCKVKKYDPLTVMNEPVSYDAELLPIEDGLTGISVRFTILNGTTIAF